MSSPLFLSSNDDMEHLTNRLATLYNLPASASVSTAIASNAGFFYTGRGNALTCYSCGLCMSFDDVGINAMTVHRQRSPGCMFVSQHLTTREPSVTVGTSHEETTSEVDLQGLPNQSATLVHDSTSVAEGRSVMDASAASLSRHRSSNGRRRQRHNWRHGHWRVHFRNDRLSVEELRTAPMTNPMLFYQSSEIMADMDFNRMSLINTSSVSNDSSRRMARRITNNDPTVLDEMKYERRRLITFAAWPMDTGITPEHLACAGMFYLYTADCVKCAFCFGILRNWAPSEDPTMKHRRLFPRCPFLRDPREAGNVAVGEEPMQQQSLNVTNITGSGNEAAELGIHTDHPYSPAMAVEATRLMTFSIYPTDIPVTSERLARAGFFYTGVNDEVCCFFCDGHIDGWQYGDDPMTKHRLLYPDCSFVRLQNEDEINSSYGMHTTDDGSGSSEDTVHSSGLQSLICLVCSAAEKNIVFLPCGHLACCSNCATSYITCPVCQKDIRGTVQVYLS